MYPGVIWEQTHLKSKEIHSSIQGKKRWPIRACHSASNGSKEAQIPKQTGLGQGLAPCFVMWPIGSQCQFLVIAPEQPGETPMVTLYK